MPENAAKSTLTNHYPVWAPRFWHGMRASQWWRVFLKNGCKLSLPKAHIAVGVSLITPINELLAFKQWLLFGRQIRKTQIQQDPIFILGHWRSGTTLLHELLVTNPQLASPNTYQCFVPSHFLVSEMMMTTLGGFLLPKQRPMDNMQAGWKLPQEDEFALMNLGVPTPYLRLAFPETQEKMLEYLTLEGLSDEELQAWQDGFMWFLKVLTYHFGGKQLVLKSPTHTGRIGVLAKMFPNAKFIHLSRDPVKLFCSTKRLWRSLEEVQALQQSQPEEQMEDYVLGCHQRMYDQFERDAKGMDSSRLARISYEELAANPLETVQQLYSQLDLGDYGAVRAPLEERLQNHKEYKPNVHRVDSVVQEKVSCAWAEYSSRYGYDIQEQPSEMVG